MFQLDSFLHCTNHRHFCPFIRLSIKNEASARQLVQAARSGRLNSWIERLRRHLSTLGARKLSAAGTEQLNRAGKELAEVNRRVTEITLA